MTTRYLEQSGVTEKLINRLVIVGVLTLGLAAGASRAASVPAPYKEVLNYIPVMPAQPVSVNPGQIEVLEFFWYGSPQCFALEPYLESWDKGKPSNVVIERVPAALNPQWDLAARAYYTALQLNISDKASAVIYAAIHINHRDLATAADYQNLFAGQLGVDAKQFASTWNSLAVNQQISQAKVLAQRYGINKVPAFTVNGKWLTGAGFHLSDAQTMGAVNWLVQREQALLPSGTP
ncbi:MAG TPA: thiol:disulfide interchange protein DsbA/DsbL [Gammaproteobacteria bacterium]|nr:thiol:disulfide interchange protein DsbA/DsbL [Gammaproteobacteria bacterium]